MADTAAEKIDARTFKAAILPTSEVSTGLSADGRYIAAVMRREHIAEDPKAALQVMKGEAPPHGWVHALVQEKMAPRGTIIDKRTGRRVPPAGDEAANVPEYQERQYHEAMKIVDSAYNVIEKGVIDTRVQRAVLQTLVQDDAYLSLLQDADPQIKDRLASYVNNPNSIPENLRAVINSIVTSGEYKVKLGKVLGKKLDIAAKSETTSEEGGADAVERQHLKEEKDSIEKRLDKEKNPNNTYAEVEEIKRKLKDYDPGGGKYDDYVKANREMNSADSERTRLQKSIESKEKTNTNGWNPGDRENLRKEIEALENKKSEAERIYSEQKAKVDEFTGNKKALDDELTKKRDSIKTDEARKKEIEIKLAKGPNEGKVLVEREKFVGELEEIFGEAAVEYLNDRASEAQRHYVEVTEQQMQKEHDELAREMDRVLMDHWLKPKSTSLATKFLGRFSLWVKGKAMVPDAEKIKRDFNTYLSIDKGPSHSVESLVDSIMRSKVEEYVKNKYKLEEGYRPEGDIKAEVDGKIAALAKERGDDAVFKMLTELTRIGLKLTPEQALQVQRTNPEIIFRVMNKDQELKEKMQQILGSGIIDPRTPVSNNFFHRELQLAANLVGLGQPLVRTVPPTPMH